MDLEIFFSGTLDDGSWFYLNQVGSMAYAEDGSLTAEMSGSVGNVLISVYQIDGVFDLEVSEGLSNGVLGSGITAEVTGADEGIFSTEDGLYRSYTGAWFWASFSLDHGKLAEYDTTWLEDGYRSMMEEPEERETEQHTLEEEIERIRTVYYDIKAQEDSLRRVEANEYITYYLDGEELKEAVVKPGAYADEGYHDDYTAEYYFDGNMLAFVFVFHGREE